MLKSILFLGKAHLGNFYAHLAIFFWSHCSLVIYLGANPGKRLENKISSKLLFSFSSAASSGLKQLKQKSAKRSCLRSFVGLLLVLFAQKWLCRWQHRGRRGWVCPPLQPQKIFILSLRQRQERYRGWFFKKYFYSPFSWFSTDFHKQHKSLTNNSINNCFSASFTGTSLKVEHRCYAWAQKEWSSPRINLTAQGVVYQCSKVF